jgi:hypothetical protein
MNEKQLQSQVTQLAKLYGWRLYHPAVSQFSEPGFPDCVLVRERVLWRELKTDKGRLTVAQSDWLTALRHAGQDAAVWREEDLRNGVITQELSASWRAA